MYAEHDSEDFNLIAEAWMSYQQNQGTRRYSADDSSI